MTAGLTHVPRTLADNAKAFQDWRYLEEIGEERILYFVEDEIMLDIIASCLKVLTYVVLSRARATAGRQPRSLREAYRILEIA